MAQAKEAQNARGTMTDCMGPGGCKMNVHHSPNQTEKAKAEQAATIARARAEAAKAPAPTGPVPPPGAPLPPMRP